MEKIRGWVYDPTNSLFGDKNGKAASYSIHCENKHGCDLYKEGQCILTGTGNYCKFGKKTCVQGPTKRARSFYSFISDQRKLHEEGNDPNITSLKAWNRIFKSNGYYYFPYSYLAPGSYGDKGKCPLESQWVKEEDITKELLDSIMTYRPLSIWGTPMDSYQKETRPKIIQDLKMYYPHLYDLLDEKYKDIDLSSYIGRNADITTCLPGKYKFGNYIWDWDGEYLTTGAGPLYFPPAKGETLIRIKPNPKSPVKIEKVEQIDENTIFMD